jgi:hypothetical protein
MNKDPPIVTEIKLIVSAKAPGIMSVILDGKLNSDYLIKEIIIVYLSDSQQVLITSVESQLIPKGDFKCLRLTRGIYELYNYLNLTKDLIIEFDEEKELQFNFKKCINLERIEILSKIEQKEIGSFYKYKNLKDIKINFKIQRFRSSMFRYCIMLEKIEVDGLEENVLDGVKV